jgi:hypothetical protein
MIPKSTDRIKDFDTRDLFDYLLQEGTGQYLILDAVPTATAPLLQDGERGIDTSDDIWIRRNNKLYQITPTSVINIT